MSVEVCTPHRLPVVVPCSHCERGCCERCREDGRGGRLCPQCAREDADIAALAEMGRESRLAMRRAGVRVSRRHGEPIILWGGPGRLALPLAGGVLLLIGAAVAAAEVRMRWGIAAALTVVALAVLVGTLVRVLFGGVSRQAGLMAALITAVVALVADRLAGSGAPDSRPVTVLADASDWVAAHAPATAACVVVAVAIAYGAAAGRRLA